MFFGKKPLTCDSARNAALVNLLATPGLGTIMLGKLAVGLAQLGLALAGFFFVLAWFVSLMVQYYGQISGDVKIKSVAWIGLVGAFLFIAAWIWALITSINLIRQARRETTSQAPPPVISP